MNEGQGTHGEGPGARVVARVPAWHRSAVAGAGFGLAVGGVGGLATLGRGLLNGSVTLIASAFVLPAALAMSGAAGGVAHHVTRGLRARGLPGHFASCFVAVYAGLGLLTAGAAIAAPFTRSEGVDPAASASVPGWVGWLVIVLVGAGCGLILGHVTRDRGPV